MANPVTVTLTADTAAPAAVDGVYSRLDVIPVGDPAQVVFALGSGGTATKGTGNEIACPPYFATCVVGRSTNGSTTVLSLISATAGQVQVRPCHCDD